MELMFVLLYDKEHKVWDFFSRTVSCFGLFSLSFSICSHITSFLEFTPTIQLVRFPRSFVTIYLLSICLFFSFFSSFVFSLCNPHSPLTWLLCLCGSELAYGHLSVLMEVMTALKQGNLRADFHRIYRHGQRAHFSSHSYCWLFIVIHRK